MAVKKDVELHPSYVRCRDLDGELWTIPAGPAGSKLHLLCWSDQQQFGAADLYIPVELLREPWRGLDWPVDLAAGVEAWKLATGQEDTQARQRIATRLYRVGQFTRLQQRVRERTGT